MQRKILILLSCVSAATMMGAVLSAPTPKEPFPFDEGALFEAVNGIVERVTFAPAEEKCQCRQFSMDTNDLNSLTGSHAAGVFNKFYQRYIEEFQTDESVKVNELKAMRSEMPDYFGHDLDHRITGQKNALTEIVKKMSALSAKVYFDAPGLADAENSMECSNNGGGACCRFPNIGQQCKDTIAKKYAPAIGTGVHTQKFQSNFELFSSRYGCNPERIYFKSSADCKCLRYSLPVDSLLNLRGSRGDTYFKLFADAWEEELRKIEDDSLKNIQKTLTDAGTSKTKIEAVYTVLKATDKAMTDAEGNKFAVKAVLFGLTGPVGPLLGAIAGGADTATNTIMEKIKAELPSAAKTAIPMAIEEFSKKVNDQAKDRTIKNYANDVRHILSEAEINKIVASLTTEEKIGAKAVGYVWKGAAAGISSLTPALAPVGSLGSSLLEAKTLMGNQLERSVVVKNQKNHARLGHSV